MVNPNTDYKDKYSHLIGKVAAKDAAHTMEANKAYGCGEWGVHSGPGGLCCKVVAGQNPQGVCWAWGGELLPAGRSGEL